MEYYVVFESVSGSEDVLHKYDNQHEALQEKEKYYHVDSTPPMIYRELKRFCEENDVCLEDLEQDLFDKERRREDEFEYE